MSAHGCINCPRCRSGCSICGRCACPRNTNRSFYGEFSLVSSFYEPALSFLQPSPLFIGAIACEDNQQPETD